MFKLNEQELKNFYKNIEIVQNGCWRWVAHIAPNGYGNIQIRKKKYNSHKISYLHFKGEIPINLVIDHLCKNRWCVNPEHLEAVTQQENILRGNSSAALQSRQTHCKNGHELSGDNLTKAGLKQKRRLCKICFNKLCNTYYYRDIESKKESTKERNRIYRLKNKDKIKEYHKQYYLNKKLNNNKII